MATTNLQALKGTRLFDGERAGDHPMVLVDGRKITQIGGDIPPAASIVDLGDVTLLPGLIDCHQHLCFDGNGTLEDQVSGVDHAALSERARLAARRALVGGVTTVRDLGDRGYVTLALRHDLTLPTILSSGPPITPEGGHCWYLGGTCTGAGELRRAVRERAERGCDVVKVMVTGGFGTPSFPMWETQFSSEELRVVVDEAQRCGLPVAAHCHGIGGIERALDAGVQSIEHCTFIAAGGNCEPPEPLLERVASSGVIVSVTLGRLPDEPLPPLVALNREAFRMARRRLHELGANIVVGTDAGINPAKPHDVLPRALDDLVSSGMTPNEGLRTLTSGAARACMVADRKGRLAVGFDADVIAVDGDPTTDTADLRNVTAVWRDGIRIR